MLVLEIHKQFKTRALYATNLELASPTPHSRVTTGTRAAAVGAKPRALRALAGFPHRVFQVVFSANAMELTKPLHRTGLVNTAENQGTATHKTQIAPLASKAIKRPVQPQAESCRGHGAEGPRASALTVRGLLPR